MSDEISLTDAAARLNQLGDPVDRSTLSRYVAKHSDALPTRRDGKSTLVSFSALQLHRRQNVRIDQHQPPAPAPMARMVPNRNDATAAKLDVETKLRELDLAQRTGLLVLTAEIDEAARDAVTRLKTSFERAISETAEQIAAKLGGEARLVRPLLKEMVRNGLDDFARAMAEIARPEAETESAAVPE